ncbi:MAG: DNA-binding protein [Firmicutes bacterium]|nr:DNA-binding protein [Bacillota bacterium]
MKDLTLSLLADYYGGLLPDKQRDMVELYYGRDLSLSEIAGLCGITRQGVKDGLDKAAAFLQTCEAALGLAARRAEAERLLASGAKPEELLKLFLPEGK